MKNLIYFFWKNIIGNMASSFLVLTDMNFK